MTALTDLTGSTTVRRIDPAGRAICSCACRVGRPVPVTEELLNQSTQTPSEHFDSRLFAPVL